MKSIAILDKTKELLSGDRQTKHGDKIINHENIARLWTAYVQNKTKLNITILPEDVAYMMALLKVARTQEGEANEDDDVDGCGYIAIGGEIKDKRKELSSTLGVNNAKTDKNTDNN